MLIMTIIPLEFTPEQVSLIDWRVSVFNAGSGEDPVSRAQYIQDRANERVIRYGEEKLAIQKAALSADPTIIELGTLLLELDDETRAEKLESIRSLITA